MPTGLYTGLSPIYNSEVSPVKHRGAIGTVNQLSVTVAILVAQVLGLSELLGTADGWPFLLGLTLAWPLLQLICLPFTPESPRYLLLTQGQRQEAHQGQSLGHHQQVHQGQSLGHRQEAHQGQSLGHH